MQHEIKTKLEELATVKSFGSEYSPSTSIALDEHVEEIDLYKDIPNEEDVLIKATSDNISTDNKWAVSSDGITWSAAPNTANELAPGLYSTHVSMDGTVYLRKKNLSTDELVELPDDATTDILAHIDDFIERRSRYEEFGFVFKRGVLLYGPQGSGKSSTIYRLINKYISNNGVVFLCDYPGYCEANIEQLRRLESDRPLLVVMEDVDDIVAAYGDRTLTKLLDGGDNVHNVVFVATTNYPERLPPRLLQRPSRFDKVQYVGMPSAEAREAYIRTIVPSMTPSVLENYVEETELLSIAQIKEVILLTLVYDISLIEAVERVVMLGKNLITGPGF